MIKKTTTAQFTDGPYMGTYDWQGGIPLSVGENMDVVVDDSTCVYVLIDKEISLTDAENDQTVHVQYFFKLSG